MALQVWLPLNKDYSNVGVGGHLSASTLGTVSIANDGPIGGCLVAGTEAQTTNGLSFGSNMISELGRHFSCAVWVKPNGNHVHYNGTIISSGNWNTTNGRWAFGVSQDNTKVDVFGPNYNQWVTCSVPVGQWTHLASVFNDGVGTLYKNGELVGTYNFGSAVFSSDTTTFTVGRETYAGGYFSFNGRISDLRIYDHCLSAKEVKEISKGLVQHLKLDDMRIGTVTNMLTAGGTYSTTTGSTWTGHYYVGTVEDAVGPVPFARMNKLEITVSGTTTGGGASLARQTNIVVQPSTQYTYSTYVKASDNLQYGHANFLYRYEYDSAGTKTIEQGVYTTAKREDIGDGWYRIWNTFTTQATTAKMHIYFYTYPGKTMTYYLGGCQLEKGSVLHPYTEGTQTNSSVIDCSGYLNNGTIYGNPSLYASAPKYECSTYIGTNNAIVAGRGGMVRPSITVAIWAYMDSWSSYSARLASCTEGGGWNFEPSSSKMNFAMGTGASSNTYKSATSSRTLASLGSGWHHFVGTYDGFTTKIYIDGVLEGSNAAYTTHTPIFYVNNAVFLGAEAAASQTVPTGSYFPGALSDFRIYGTALSAEDVAELYHTAASVDNHGNFFCGELKEV